MSDPYKVDIKLIQSFKPEQYQEYEQIFKAIDKDRNGYLDQKELINMMKSLGYRNVTEEQCDKLIQEVDLNKDGVIQFEEYLLMMKKFVDTGKESEFTRIVNKQGKGILKVGSTMDQMSFSSFSEEERAAYVKMINTSLEDDEDCKQYLPIEPDNNEIFPRLKNGLILCKLINKAVPGTILDKAINKKDNMSVFHQVENLNLAINAAKAIGCKITNVRSSTFMEEDSVAILGILWQVVKKIVLTKINLKQFPQLVRLLKEGEQLSDLLKLSPEELLLRWFNYHLKNANYPTEVTNFGKDIADSEKYTILLNQLDSKQCDKSALNESDLNKRAQTVIDNAKKLGAESYITSNDICKGNQKLNTLFAAEIFNACPGLDPPTEQEAYEAAKLLEDDAEGGREERAFRMWINSLGLEGVQVNNLYEDLKSGILLCKLLEVVEPGCVDWKKIDQKSTNVFKLHANCVEAVEAAKKCKYSIVGIGGKDIHDGNKKLDLAIIWQIMRRHTLKIIGNKTEEELIEWGNQRVRDELKIKTLKSKDLSNSLYFIEILASIEPRAVNWDLVTKENLEDKDKEQNAKYAMAIARKLNCCIFFVWEDITEVKYRLLLTFLAEIYNVAQTYKPA